VGEYPRNEKGFISLIALLVVLALICYFAYYVVNAYFGSQVSRQTLETEAINAGKSNIPAGYRSVVSDTRDKLQEINKKSAEQMNQIEEELNK